MVKDDDQKTAGGSVVEENIQKGVENVDQDSQKVVKQRPSSSSRDSQPSESQHDEETEEAQEVEQEESTEDLLSLEEELDKIRVSAAAPYIVELLPEMFESLNLPESYRINSNREKMALSYAENFRKQFVHLYRDRKPLLLSPMNELQVEKLVCTTVQPTELRYGELYDWDGAADFVADYLNFIPLEPLHELPTRLLSPSTVLRLQQGHCFEYSTVLASLLIGVGYDAYVVSGYATKEICLMDETRETCPMMKTAAEVIKEKVRPPFNKYTVRAPKDLRSKYELKMEERRLKQQADEEQLHREAEELRLHELELPEIDCLHGLRVHSWVLVLAGRRDVVESFFIEPLTGLPHPLDTGNYLGIESVWNHRNYWVNMQDCSEGVTKLSYDLGDCALWEFMFPSNERPRQSRASVQQQNADDDPDDVEDVDDEEEDDDDVADEDVEKHMDVPPSWTLPIEISSEEFNLRCPQGRKTKLYKRAKLEKFAPYVCNDGLVCRLTVYDDNELTLLHEVRELYKNRADKLYERHYDYITEWVTEKFGRGRSRHLQEHRYRLNGGLLPEGERTMLFYHTARVDGLEKRTETPTQVTEHFVNRDDFLIYRRVEFASRLKQFGPASEQTSSSVDRNIERMTERYSRNASKDANDDIAEVVYLVADEKTHVTCHREDNKISASTRQFVKPSITDDKGESGVVWNVDGSYSAFLSDANKSDKKNVELYQLMMELLQAEERCVENVRQSESEVRDLLVDRSREELLTELSVSIYDTQRNDKAKRHRELLERQQQLLLAQSQERELDYLEPFLAQLDVEDWTDVQLTRAQAVKLREDCLTDMKQRLVDKANIIQARFDKETQELQKRQAWYQQHQITIHKADEQEYVAYCSDAMFRIHILEQRLNRHKELAPLLYTQLEHKLRSDPRLAECH